MTAINVKIINVELMSETKDRGYVMRFDAYFPEPRVALKSLILVRPDTDPRSTWLYLQKNKDGYHTATLAPETRQAIGEAATAIYNDQRAVKLRFKMRDCELGPDYTFRVTRPVDEAADAGLRRVVGEAERDSLRMAGLG